MNERSLRIFYEVATRLNMTEVAENLAISQPAVSQTIRELETEFEVRFFDRIGRRLYLTREGELFLEYARRILNLYQECVQTIGELRGLMKGRLNVGASTTIGIYILTDIIGQFQKLNRGIEVAINIENTRIIENFILENRIDFAFVEGPVGSAEIAVEYFCGDELVFIVPPEHPWTLRDRVDLADLARERILMREEGSGTRAVIENALRAAGAEYRIGMELGNTEAIKRAVAAGLGISCVSKRCIRQEVADGRLRIVAVAGLAVHRDLNLIYHRDKYLSQLFKSFIEFCKTAANANLS
ncbi:DNA-binding transcriptional LysR family regulator [Hydrogenispora ethanolica]|uniref:DNA-binding transcriptional LysR family regulator n=1 Tax=Hydrogenispora ethanolica TaxID=1082276 RepID=A0A4R1SBD1_HYDET|nr:LysR family transcriptional regulator [Hydrogenispora ethanolica]TCL76856.1 DNA-binding transcriptional LysR family regulator [Hydrogenispora ethanolica]